MNEEEKEAIENIKALKFLFEIDDNKDFEATPLVQREIALDLEIILNLIKKLKENCKKCIIKDELDEYVNNSISVQEVKDMIEELDKKVKDYQCVENRINLYQRKILQELLEKSQNYLDYQGSEE